MSLVEAQNLVALHRGRLSGSRAFGQPRADSDWDYYMAEREVKRLAKTLTAQRVPWSSAFLGSLTFHTDEGWQIEVSYLFPRSAKSHHPKGGRS